MLTCAGTTVRPLPSPNAPVIEPVQRRGCQAVNGDYIIHPEVFIGERNVEFVGRDEPVKGLSLAMEGKE